MLYRIRKLLIKLRSLIVELRLLSIDDNKILEVITIEFMNVLQSILENI